MAKKDPQDRRQFQRLERQDEILIKEYSYPERGEYQKARIMDLSGGGLLIETKQHFPDHTAVKIEMNFTGWQQHTASFLKYFGEAAHRPLVVLGEVIRCTRIVAGAKYETAVTFTGIDENHRQALIRFIRTRITRRD